MEAGRGRCLSEIETCCAPDEGGHVAQDVRLSELATFAVSRTIFDILR
jgi:hypothetical protein